MLWVGMRCFGMEVVPPLFLAFPLALLVFLCLFIYPDPPILGFLDLLAFFLCDDILALLCLFPSFPRISRVRLKINPCLFSGLLAFYPKEQEREARLRVCFTLGNFVKAQGHLLQEDMNWLHHRDDLKNSKHVRRTWKKVPEKGTYHFHRPTLMGGVGFADGVTTGAIHDISRSAPFACRPRILASKTTLKRLVKPWSAWALNEEESLPEFVNQIWQDFLRCYMEQFKTSSKACSRQLRV